MTFFFLFLFALLYRARVKVSNDYDQNVLKCDLTNVGLVKGLFMAFDPFDLIVLLPCVCMMMMRIIIYVQHIWLLVNVF